MVRTGAATGPRAGAQRSTWLPDQHGAWAMLAVPFLAGTFLAPRPGWANAALFAAWLLGYVAAFHAQQWLRLSTRGLRSARRHRRPALVSAAAFAVVGVPLAVLYPWLLVACLLAAPFVAVNTYHAWRGRERALLNGLAAVVPACGMLLVAGRLAGAEPEALWRPAAACLLYFAGTVPYVKTMIRERNSRAYRAGSVAYHAAALAAAACLSPWLVLPFTAYLARAAALPGRGLRVPIVGAVELAASLTLLTTLLLTTPSPAGV
ncbi:YwiC-like family protein [Streptomyces erythrochromogenes]|uniref:YwiC-like family protein n=1 Tax=Streptomyces erythrochromogenes TaxID=285574 RepID=UPI0036BB48A5